MPEYNNRNRGVLFPQKDTSGKKPQYKGKITEIDCPHCQRIFDKDVAGWKQTSKAGSQYLSLKIQDPWQKEDSVAEEADRRAEQDDLDDTIPF